MQNQVIAVICLNHVLHSLHIILLPSHLLFFLNVFQTFSFMSHLEKVSGKSRICGLSRGAGSPESK